MGNLGLDIMMQQIVDFSKIVNLLKNLGPLEKRVFESF